MKVCEETARVWLHDMGFSYRQFSKGIYFDGHEQEDVVQHRKDYLAILTSLHHRMLCTPPSQLPPPTSTPPPIIRIFHDESHSMLMLTSLTAGQMAQTRLLGQAVMVSDFIDEVDGYLKFQEEEARLYLEHQSKGYFTNDLFVEQMGRAVDNIFEKKYPGVIGLFIFDNAPSHCKKPDDCFNPDKMNVSDGGKQQYHMEWVHSEDDTG